DYAHALKMDLGLPSLRYDTDQKRIAFYRDLTQQVQSLPGVMSAGVVTPLPSARDFDMTSIYIETQPVPPGQAPSVDRYIMTPGYLRALGIQLERGRELTDQDVPDAPLVLLVSE